MKKLLLVPVLFLFACDNQQREERIATLDSTFIKPEIPLVHPLTPDTTSVDTSAQPDTIKTYGNKRFKDVIVKRIGEDQFQISGQAQVFEASFSWVLEDGHNELKQGHEMTDAGAPEFGNFSFKLIAQKREPNTTLHLILYEVSAKNGSRQHELPIPLY
ncbi:MAG TPA: Gmad2 immunoglobulin-like domain-containing protein [Flavipsychrobacter sp.]|nr:Gmad2 immunoglobulin-like domain-containing protein [Flavipsychrobacter sp.]